MGEQAGNIQSISAQAVSDANDRTFDMLSFQVDEKQQISSDIIPSRIVSEKFLVQDSAIPLISDIGNPDSSNPEAFFFRTREKFVPEWFI